MSKAPAYQEYAADYLADETISLMTLEEEGILARLKNQCWNTENKTIPSDLNKLSRLCKNPSIEVLKAVVDACFRPHPTLSDRLIYPNHEIQKAKQLEWRLKSVEAGRKSAKVRGENKAKSVEINQSSAEVEPTIQPNANQHSRLVEPQIEPNANSSFLSLSLSSSSSSSKDKEQKPSRDKREEQAPPFLSEVKDLIFRYYRSKNEGRDPEWDGAEGKQLSKLLKASPKADIDHWVRCLSNRYHSEETHGDRPMLWISRLSSYSNGPLNQYKKPLKEKSNGTTGNYSKAKSAGTVDALRDSLEREPDQDHACEAGGEASDADRGSGFQDLQRRPYALPAGGHC
jgi:hypothetical protein